MAAVKLQFARFTLGLHSRTLKTLALADLGVLPLQSHRLQLTVRYYTYANSNPSHLAWAALKYSKKSSHSSVPPSTWETWMVLLPLGHFYPEC